MSTQDIDSLLRENLSGGPSTDPFRAQVLRESTAAFIGARRRRGQWRLAGLSAAAIFIAVVSFLIGRSAVPSNSITADPIAGDVPGRVAVPSDVVEWLEAANLFRQLGMEERMARAIRRAGQLSSDDTAPMRSSVGSVMVDDMASVPLEGSPRRPSEKSPPPVYGETMNRIMAQSFGE